MATIWNTLKEEIMNLNQSPSYKLNIKLRIHLKYHQAYPHQQMGLLGAALSYCNKTCCKAEGRT